MMLTKPEAKYAMAKPGGDQCYECKWYRPSKRCEIVEGDISPNGWRKVFHRGARDADAGRDHVRQMRGR